MKKNMENTNLFTSAELKGQLGVDGNITVSFDGHIAIMHILCGENRINFDFISKLHSALDEVERNENAQVLITISDGKIYSNGIDLNWFSALGPEKSKRFTLQHIAGIFKRLSTFPLPTIAALNGHAFAGGFMLALCHDYIVMSSTRGWVCLNEVQLGMLFTPFMKNIIQAKLPSGMPMHEAMVLGKRFTAEEALSKKIVHQICPIGELLDTAKSLGNSLIKRGAYNRESLQNMKKDLYGYCFDNKAKL